MFAQLAISSIRSHNGIQQVMSMTDGGKLSAWALFRSSRCTSGDVVGPFKMRTETLLIN